MKCSKCKFNCSESLDLCPKCDEDLRPLKKALGLPIGNYKATHKELLAAKKGVVDTGVMKRNAKDQQLEGGKSLAPKEITGDKREGGAAVVSSQIVGGATPVSLQAVKLKSAQFIATAVTTAEFDKLYAQAVEQLNKDRPSDQEIELTAEELAGSRWSEELDVLYFIAEGSCQNPAVLDKYKAGGSTSELKKIIAKDLERELKNVEKSISTPLFSLRSLAKGASAKEASQKAISVPSPVARFGALLADLLVIGMTSLLLAIVVDMIQGGLLFRTLISGGVSSTFDVIDRLKLLTLSFLVVSFLYPIVTLISWGQTVGMNIFSLKLLRDNGSAAALGNILVRCLSIPLSMICFGFLGGILIGDRSLHDRVAKTYVTVKEKERNRVALVSKKPGKRT